MSYGVDGGPAFPRALPTCEVSPDRALEIIVEYAGMSLRDYFAAKAMQALQSRLLANYDDEGDAAAKVARLAYAQADAMLKARG